VTDVYCIEGCGRPATTESTIGVTSDGDEIAELLCSPCAASSPNFAETATSELGVPPRNQVSSPETQISDLSASSQLPETGGFAVSSTETDFLPETRSSELGVLTENSDPRRETRFLEIPATSQLPRFPRKPVSGHETQFPEIPGRSELPRLAGNPVSGHETQILRETPTSGRESPGQSPGLRRTWVLPAFARTADPTSLAEERA